jgi:hypothetical protein
MIAAFMTGYMGKTAGAAEDFWTPEEKALADTDLVGTPSWKPSRLPHGGITRHPIPGVDPLKTPEIEDWQQPGGQTLGTPGRITNKLLPPDTVLGSPGRFDEQGNEIPVERRSVSAYGDGSTYSGDVTRRADIGEVDKDSPLYNVADPRSSQLTPSDLDSGITGGNITPTPPADNKVWDWKNPVLRGGVTGFASGASISVILDWLRDKPTSVRRMALMAVLGGAAGALYQALEGSPGIKSLATKGADATRNKVEELKNWYHTQTEKKTPVNP